MGIRRQARETALQILYLVDVGGISLEAASKACAGAPLPSPTVQCFTDRLASGTLAIRKELDEFISKYTENWEISRMAAVDRNILRLAAYELLHHPETPIPVVIDEAVEIAKTYSTQDSGKFVNGILDKIKLERPSSP